jgi:imidazoleglycerol-phosphate dehydratase
LARTTKIERKTAETDIKIGLNLDGRGKNDINTGIKMFDHLLTQVAVHGRFDLSISAAGDDQHHLIEDVAICLGKAFLEAFGDKRGIVRMGDASVPMDDSLATVTVDLSGRGYSVLDLPFSSGSEKGQLLGFPPELIRHFLESLATEGRMNLHARVIYGKDDHHKAEAVFKALGRALDQAVRIDPRIAGEIPSTKKSLEC